MKMIYTDGGDGNDVVVVCTDPEFAEVADQDDEIVVVSLEWIPDAHRLIVHIKKGSAGYEPTIEFHTDSPVIVGETQRSRSSEN